MRDEEEHRSVAKQSLDALKSEMTATVPVKRDGVMVVMPLAELVPDVRPAVAVRVRQVPASEPRHPYLWSPLQDLHRLRPTVEGRQ